MFEVNLFTPAQFGAFVPWLAIWRGPLSVLIHPNTVGEGLGELEAELRNHSERAIWMGERVPLDWAGAVRVAGAKPGSGVEGLQSTASSSNGAGTGGGSARSGE